MRMRRLLPKVTYDLAEYNRLAHDDEAANEPGFYIHGLYYNGVIWSRKPSFLTILHEVVHFIFSVVGDLPSNGSTRLFFDFLDSFYDAAWSITRFRNNQISFWHFMGNVKDCWSDFLDFQLCRDVGLYDKTT